MGSHYICKYCGDNFCDEKTCTPEAVKDYEQDLAKRTKKLENLKRLYNSVGVQFYVSKEDPRDDLPKITLYRDEMEKLARRYADSLRTISFFLSSTGRRQKRTE